MSTRAIVFVKVDDGVYRCETRIPGDHDGYVARKGRGWQVVIRSGGGPIPSHYVATDGRVYVSRFAASLEATARRPTP